MMVNAYRTRMTHEMLAANAIGGFTREFWAEIDRQIIQMRDQEIGMEIVNDLMGVQTVLLTADCKGTGVSCGPTVTFITPSMT